MKRSELLELLTANILGIKHERPLLVAIDGYDAAGKSILAKVLAEKLRGLGLNIIEASIDGFHNPRVIRYKRGEESPEGYYYDSFNYAALKVMLLDSLKTGDMRYKTQPFDYVADKGIMSTYSEAEIDSILIFDGVFALRPELRDYWDYSIYLYVDEDVSLARGVARDPGDEEAIRHRYNVRYIPGQRIYHQEAEPMKHASIVIDNNDPENPEIKQV
ncbi:uridine kinase [Candidatus Bathyarchaeota archaeon]|nr:uridine kinase [Candidatus Bathyarchaeota archaeon]